MKCPNCNAELTLTALMKYRENKPAHWYGTTYGKMRCPQCDSAVAFTGAAQVILILGLLINIGVHTCTLVYPANQYKLELAVVGVLSLAFGIIFWFFKKRLKLQK